MCKSEPHSREFFASLPARLSDAAIEEQEQEQEQQQRGEARRGRGEAREGRGGEGREGAAGGRPWAKPDPQRTHWLLIAHVWASAAAEERETYSQASPTPLHPPAYISRVLKSPSVT